MLSAEQGNVEAMTDLGVAFKFGRGVSQDIARAAQLFVLAAHEGDPVAIGNLSDIFDQLKTLAQQNDPYAQYYLGVIYKRGFAIDHDDVLACAWFSVALDNPEMSGEKKEQCEFLVREIRKELSEEEIKLAEH